MTIEVQDIDLGTHKQRVRTIAWGTGELGIVNVTIAAAGVATGNFLSAPGYSHFAGVLASTTPLATTISIRVQPRISFVGAQQYVVATIAAPAAAGVQRYPFYWGEARGILADVAGVGSNYCFSRIFRFVVVNTGAESANDTTLERLEAI